MKRNGNIGSLFQRHAAKKLAAASSPSPAPAANVVEEENREEEAPAANVVEEENQEQEGPAANMVEEKNQEQEEPAYDINRLPHDPGLRLSIASYHVNDQDAVRRLYVLRGPFKPIAHQFPKRKIGDRDCSCSPLWLYKHNWVEYSIKVDCVFCFYCYLFKDKESKGKGTNAFTVKGWRNWNMGEQTLLKHMDSKAHKAAQEKLVGFMDPGAQIDNKIEK